MLDLLLSPLTRRRRFLDGRSDVAAAYSLRRLRSAHPGPLARVRRSSDNLEADFGAGQGDVSWGTILSFIGAGNGFVTRWYDQSGNGRDLAQATASAQPRLILAANGLPALLFDGSNDIMAVAFTPLAQPWSFNLCYRRVATVQPSFENIIDGSAGSDTGTLLHNITGTGGPTDNAMYAGFFGPQSDNGVSMATGVRGVVGGCFNGASSLLEVNATTIASATGNPGAGIPNGLTIGSRADNAAGRNTNMEAQEFIAFNTAHTSAQLKADNGAMRSAWRF